MQLTQLLLIHGFSEDEAKLAATQVISRAVYPASELKTTRWIKENSAVCEFTGYDMEKLTKDKLYQSALHLYKVKDTLEKHLSARTNSVADYPADNTTSPNNEVAGGKRQRQEDSPFD